MTVTIYTTSTCPWCHATKEFFQEHNVQYAEKDAHDAAVQAEMVDLSGQMGVPVTVIQKEGQVKPDVVVGFDKGKLAQSLGIAL